MALPLLRDFFVRIFSVLRNVSNSRVLGPVRYQTGNYPAMHKFQQKGKSVGPDLSLPGNRIQKLVTIVCSGQTSLACYRLLAAPQTARPMDRRVDSIIQMMITAAVFRILTMQNFQTAQEALQSRIDTVDTRDETNGASNAPFDLVCWMTLFIVPAE